MQKTVRLGAGKIPATPLQRLWLSETIRLHEQYNPLLEDSAACRQALAKGKTMQERIELRNLALAHREGLDVAMRHWVAAAWWLGVALFILALLAGYGLASASLSRQADTINVVWAIFGLLGLNLLALLFWVLGLIYRPGQPSQLFQLPLLALERLSRSPHAAQLSAALIGLLAKQRLLLTAISRLVHGWWSLVLLVALLTSLVLLSTHRYVFVWETTIANPDSFVALVHILGWPGQLLGFTLPDAELIRTSGEKLLLDEVSRQGWASWLMGVLVAYGLIPRVLLALFFQWRWVSGKSRLQLEAATADWAYLHARLQTVQLDDRITDPQPLTIQQPVAAVPTGLAGHDCILGLELEQPLRWPVTPPAYLQQLGNLDGYADQQKLLQQLAGNPDRQVILACDSRRSPDRGSLYFISELASSCADVCVWFLYPDQDVQRLSDWQQALQELNIKSSTSAPWLDTGVQSDD